MAKPVLLTVDDDPDVLRAVERDLRRHYGGEFRVIRADGGESALEALRGIKQRGDAVALFLVDQRMPRMSGVELLERAIPLFPDAKRVLLTAYADTDAAIRAINRHARRLLPAQAVGPPGGAALPRAGRPPGRLARRAPPGPRGGAGGGAPLVAAVARAQGLPGPQRGALHLAGRGGRAGSLRPPGADGAGGGAPPGGPPPGRLAPGGPLARRAGGAGGVPDEAGAPVLRPGHRGRRAGRAGGRGVRRLGGAADAPASSARRRGDRRGRARASRTTWASRPGSRARTWRAARWPRRASSGWRS